jgi:hypothetical protein
MTSPGGQFVVFLLQPDQLGFQVAHAPLEATHFGYYAGIRPADVAE